MSDSFVTQCPHCQTSFRVSHAQLGMARGVVRCGACLQVFNAAQQLLNQSTETGQPPAVEMPVVAAPEVIEPAPVEVPAPTVPVNPAPWQTSTIDLDHLDLDEELAKLEEREIQPSKSFGQPHKPKTTSLSARRETSDAEEGEWSDSLFSESAADRAESAKVAGQAAEIAQTERLSATEDEDDARPEPAPVSKDRRKRNEPAMGEDPLMDLVDDPLQLDWQKRRTPWGKRLLWSLLVLLAAAALAGQYIANHFDELARQDQYRPIFQQLCPQIGCTVPSKVDIDRIKSSNLVVRSHPEFAGALVVDAILYNRAPFSQPFPLLELRFADLNGKMIASRRFKPGEYLSGDLAKAEMPPQTPIHIALDILDPGPKAVNYSLSFHSPE